MISLYHPAQSIIHNIAAGYKVLLLLILGTTLFQVDRLEILVGAAVGVSLLYVLAKIPVKLAFQQLKPALFLLAIIFLAQIFILGFEAAIFVVLRFLTLILAANLVTLTTLMSHMIGAIEKGLSVFGRWLPVAKVSLALSLTIRFIPVIGVMADEVREAQRVRGMERNIFAIAMPLVIRTLKMGTEVAEALDARGFDTEDETDSKNRSI
ncbi:MAG: energy-coupling factor transporter transmembrane protein EcfT [Sneathiella sp.]|nr:energy-coupling factor transporter transmembrane protein EcfT [Sneathiella sp.]